MFLSRIFLISLSFSYFIFPLIVYSSFLESNFYIYAPNFESSYWPSFIAGVTTIIFSYFVTSTRHNIDYYKNLNLIEKSKLINICFYLYLVIIFFEIIYGVKLRLNGAIRSELFEEQNIFLFSGAGFLLSAAGLYLVTTKSKLIFNLFFILSLFADILYGGKINTFFAVACFVIRFDLNRVIFKNLSNYKILLLLSIPSLFFFLIIGLLRLGDASDNEIGTIIYLMFSEFIGVHASISWADYYSTQSNVFIFRHFGQLLQEYYLDSVGHGLATNPFAFFIYYFNENSLFYYLIFLYVMFYIFRVLMKIFGAGLIMIFIVTNFQHFMRHGIDVFAIKILLSISIAIWLLSFHKITYLALQK